MIGEQIHPEKQHKVGQILLLGMEEVMGEENLNALLSLCELPRLKPGLTPHKLDNQLIGSDCRKIQAALRSQYGPLSARGLALRSGRECFKYGLHEYGQRAGMLDMKFRLLPTQAKLKTGLTSLARLIGEIGAFQTQIEENEHQYIWRMVPTCPLCWNEPTGGVTCPTLTGLLQEFLYWASGGKRYSVVDSSVVDYQVIDSKVVEDALPSPHTQSGCKLLIDKLAFE
jgi:hypothetical protein